MTKRILLTGAGSYIGMQFTDWLAQHPDKYKIKTVDMKGNWTNETFDGYDVVFHVAGIVHCKKSEANASLYESVNNELAVKTAQKAKNEGVTHFIFLSSMSVYGRDMGVITAETPCNPVSPYGYSKLHAEEGIKSLADDKFCVSILRLPMVYGHGCRGNYPRLRNLALNVSLFPNYPNKRSMLFIDNLCEFVRQLIDHPKAGIFFPQNEEFVCSSNLVCEIANCSNKNIKLTKAFNWVIRLLLPYSITIQKVFGDLIYDKKMSENLTDYQVCNLKESIKKTELGEAYHE